MINSIIHGFEHTNSGEISINITFNDQRLTIDYQDNGCGVTEAQLANLFEAFYTSKADNGGTGLGTHIIKNLVTDTLNGQIKANNLTTGGLQYNIELPDMRYS